MSGAEKSAWICILSVAIVFGVIGGLIGYYAFDKSDNDSCSTPVDILNTDASRDAFRDCLELAVNGSESSFVVFPWSEEYYNASQVFSKFYQSYPIAIVYVDSESTVISTSICASTYGIPITPRSGGHGNAGNSVATGAITIDLSLMTEVVIADDNKTATVQAGNTAGTAAFQLLNQSNGHFSIPIGQKPTVGISGLTLGGGFGFSTRLVGLLCDNLVSIRGITALGELIIADKTQNSDLFWASCGGGGGSFVTVTEFNFKLFDVSRNVTEIHYLIAMTSTANAADTIAQYQNVSYAFENRVTANLEVVNASFMAVTGFFAGEEEDFDEALASADPMNYFPLENWNTKNTHYVQAVLDLSGWDTETPQSLRAKFEEERNYYQFKSFLLPGYLSYTAREMIVEAVELADEIGLVFEFQSLGGADSAFSLVPLHDTAIAFRNTWHVMMLKSWGPDLRSGEEMFGKMSNLSYNLADYIDGQGAYVNHMDYELWNFERAYYGLPGEDWDETLYKLRDVGSKYDPDNILSGLQLF